MRTVRAKQSGSIQCEAGSMTLRGERMPRCEAWVDGIAYEVEFTDGNLFCAASVDIRIVGVVDPHDNGRKLVEVGGRLYPLCPACLATAKSQQEVAQ